MGETTSIISRRSGVASRLSVFVLSLLRLVFFCNDNSLKSIRLPLSLLALSFRCSTRIKRLGKLLQHCSTSRLSPLYNSSSTDSTATDDTTANRRRIWRSTAQREPKRSYKDHYTQRSAPIPTASRTDDVREDSIRDEECPGDELLEYIPRSARGDLRQGDRSRTSTLDVESVSPVVRREKADEPDEQTGYNDEDWIVRHVRRLECVPRKSR